MGISQTAIGLLYLYGALLGVGAGLFYDLLRVTRIFLGAHYSRSLSEKLRKIELPLLSPYREHEESPALGAVIFLEDLFFCVLSGVALSILYYEQNDGKIRPLVIAACALGFFLYRLTLGRLFLWFSEAAAFALDCIVRYLWYFLSYPFRAAWKLLRRIGTKLILKIQSHFRQFCRVRFSKKELQKAEAGRGLFPDLDLPVVKKKRGKEDGIRKKATVQSVSFGQDLSGSPRCAVGRRFRNKRHEVQPLAGRRT